MGDLVLQTVKEEDLKDILSLLKSKELLLERENCPLCEGKITDIGGFLPKNGKIMPICNALKCTLEASFLVMKFNGNGKPIIEE